MCGINFLWTEDDPRVAEQQLLRMNHALAHRGPDGSGVRIRRLRNGAHLLFGHTLLNISSPHSPQPAEDLASGDLLLFNGEIYNHLALRRLPLFKDLPYRNGSDTETIFRILQQEGPEALKRFNGMYALLYFRAADESLFAARDPSGIKPLYVANSGTEAGMASEIRALKITGLFGNKINSDAVSHYLLFKYCTPGSTGFTDIQEHMPGTVARFNPTCGCFDFHFKLSLPASDAEGGTVEQRLKLAVAGQRSTHHPEGLLLSGGVDSGLLGALLKETGPAPTAYTARCVDVLHDSEAVNAADTAQILGLHHMQVDYTAWSMEDLWMDTHTGTALLPADPALLLTSLVAKEAQKRVLFSGAGADELFGGYRRHRAIQLYFKLRALPGFPFLERMLGTGLQYSRLPVPPAYIKTLTGMSSSALASFINFTAINQDLVKDNRLKNMSPTGDHNIKQLLDYDRFNYLIYNILNVTDCASMSHSTEVRVPFLDQEFLKFIDAAPAATRVAWIGKKPLKEMLKIRGLEQLCSRPKTGFGFPLAQWLREGKFTCLRSELQRTGHPLHEYVDVKVLQRKLASPHIYAHELYTLAVVGRFLSQNG